MTSLVKLSLLRRHLCPLGSGSLFLFLSARTCPPQHIQLSTLSSKASALDLPESLGPAENRNGAYETDNRQDLEQIPGSVVEEEDKLHGHNGAKEQSVRNGGSTKSLGEVVRIGAKNEPLLNTLSVTIPTPYKYPGKLQLTPMNRAGTLAATASAKNKEITLGGLRGSSRKVW